MTWGTHILRKATLKVQAVTGPDATTEETTEDATMSGSVRRQEAQQHHLCVYNGPPVALVTNTQLLHNSFSRHVFTEGLRCATHYECAEKLTKNRMYACHRVKGRILFL